MKKLFIILFLLPFLGQAQTTYQLNYDSIRVNKTAGTGGTSLYGKVYLKNVGLGLVSDSILTVLNGRIRKVPNSGLTGYIQNQHASQQSASAWVDSLQAQKFRSGTAPYYNKANFVVKQNITNHAFYGYVDNSTITWNTDSVRGHNSYLSAVTMTGTGTGDHHHAFQASDNYTGSDSLINMSAFLSGQGHTGAGKLINVKAFDGTSDIQGSGYVGNNYGLFLGNRARGTISNFQIYTDGTAESRFGGRIRLNDGLYLTNGIINLSGVNAAKIIGGGVTTAIRNDVDAVDMLSFNNSTTNATFNGTVTLADEAYSSSWNGKLEAPTKNAIYDAGFSTTSGTVTSVAALTLGTTGTDLSSSVANGTTTPVITLNVPDASATARGVVTTGTQTFAGEKTIQSSGSGNTLSVNHASGNGAALNITKGGNGEGLYVDKTSGSGNAATIIGTLNATTLVKSGGTSSQFLKADGTVDGTAYGTGTVTSVAALTLGTTGTDLSSSVANGTTTPVITLNVPTASAANRGALSSADWTTFNGKQAALSGTGIVKSTAGVISYLTDPLPIANGGTGSATQNFVDLTTAQTIGGAKTLTAALAATSATFSGEITSTITSGAAFGARTATTLAKYLDVWNTGGTLQIGVDNSTGTGGLLTGSSAYAVVIAQAANADLKLGTNGITRQTISGAGDVTFTGNVSAANLTSGTYTPSLTNVLNVSGASNEGDAQYQRIGNIVTVYGMVSFTMTASGNSQIDISLPIASNFTTTSQAHGMGVTFKTVSTNGVVSSNVADDRATLTFVANSGDTSHFRYTFSYQIL